MSSMQDFTDVPVPKGKGPRYGWLYLTNVENAVTICVPVFMFGAMLGGSLSATMLLLALALAAVVLSLFSGWSSYIGSKTRMSTALLVQSSFGEQGAKVVWFLLALSLMGWFGVQTEMFAKAFMMLMGVVAPNVEVSSNFVTIASGVLISSTAILGIRGVGKLAQLAIPLLLGVMIYALYIVFSTKGLTVWTAYTPAQPMALGAAVAAIIGAYGVGIIVMPDIKRFSIDAKHAVVSAVLGLGLIYPFLLLMTAFMSSIMQQPDFMKLLVELGMGSFVLIVLMLATWTTNDLNLYSASLNLSSLLPNLSRPWLAAIAGGVGTVVATYGVFENLIPLFSMLGVLTTPLLAIYSVDFLSGRYEKGSLRCGVVWSALVVWGMASFVGILTTPKAGFGLEVFTLTTVPSLDSLIAGVLLVSVCHLYKRKDRAFARF